MRKIRMTKVAIIVMGILCVVLTVLGPRIVGLIMERPSVLVLPQWSAYVVLGTLIGVYLLFFLVSAKELYEMFTMPWSEMQAWQAGGTNRYFCSRGIILCVDAASA